MTLSVVDAQSEACKALVTEAVDVLGGTLDVVVNNAGGP